MSERRGRRISFRTEATTLLAGLLVLFALLSSMSYFGYRATLAAWQEREALLAARWAERLGHALSEGRVNSDAALAREAPPRAAAAVFDREGNLLWVHGFDRPPEARLEGVSWPPERLVVQTLTASEAPATVALLPMTGTDRVLRFELPAIELAARQKAFSQLTPWMVGVGLGALFLLTVYSRALLGRYERWMASLGQALGSGFPAARDEDLLLESVERALAQLRSQGPVSGELERPTVRPEEVESGFLLLDRTGCLLTANDRASQLLELPREAAGQPLESVFAHHPQLVRELGPLCRSGQALPRGELELVRRDGTRFGIGYVVEPLRRPDGILRGCLILIAPLEALDARQREAHLLQTLGELGELAAGVAHELRNGLGTLSGQLELLERGRAADPELLEEARREVSQLLRVVTDFLDFARPGTALLEPIEIQTLTERLARDPIFSPPGVEVQGAPGLPRIRGDEVLLRRAVSNLLANAVAAHREVGRNDPVKLELQLHGRHVLLSVRDRGSGLPPGDPERLFDPFRSLRPGGTGLGLALARRVAWLHGGQLVLSNHPEGGVEAQMTLPVVGEEAPNNSEASRPF